MGTSLQSYLATTQLETISVNAVIESHQPKDMEDIQRLWRMPVGLQAIGDSKNIGLFE